MYGLLDIAPGMCNALGMPKRSSKPEPDENQIAKSVVEKATGIRVDQVKNPAAVELGRLGGKKGGPARAKMLSKKRRREIAKKAADARWSKRTNDR